MTAPLSNTTPVTIPTALAPRYVTTPIYYVNDKPHIGHAYTTIAADFFSRFWRLQGRPTYFLTGTDENGLKIQRTAENLGEPPQGYVDRMAAVFQDMTRRVGACPDDFLRTTQPRHMKGAQAFWTTLQELGYIYKGTYAGWYAVQDEAYYSADDVHDGKAPTGACVEWVEEACYFFKLSAFQEPLLRFYADHPHFIAPASRYNEVKRWVERGLQDLAISRSTFSWGIPVPGDDSHVMYVWVEALSNYITALGYPEKTPQFETFWPQALHLVGKDILRFHGVYWPAFLMAAGLPTPQRLFAHGWWTNTGQKISKSLGNVIDPLALMDDWGVDPVRYFLLREISFGGDGDFSIDALSRRYKSDLANDLGNLAQRVLAFLHKHLGSTVPTPSADYGASAEHDMLASAPLTSWMQTLEPALTLCVENLQPNRYLECLWEGIGLGNQFVDTLKPWSLIKSTDPHHRAALNQGLFTLMELLRCVGIFLLPVMPGSAQSLLAQLGVGLATDTGEAARGGGILQAYPSLCPGMTVPPPQALFPARQIQPSQTRASQIATP